MFKIKTIKKTVAVITNLSLLLNSFVPFLLATQPVYAEEATPTEIITPTITPEPTIQPTIEPTITPETTPTETITPTIESTITPTPELTPEPQQIITPTSTPIPSTIDDLSPTISFTPTEIPVLVEQTTNNWTFENVQLNKEYVAPQNSRVKLTFTKLPENSGNIKIEEITLTREQIEQTGSLSDKAYDITSDMTDGTFAYNLSLPIPESSKGKDIDIKFAEEISQINSAQTADNTTENNLTATTSNLNHFTLFIVTYSDPSLTVKKYSYIQGETVYAEILNPVYYSSRIVFQDNNGNTIKTCPVVNGHFVSCSYTLSNNDTIGTWSAIFEKEIFGSYSKIDSINFEVLSQNCNYSCPTKNFTATRIIIDVPEHYADCTNGIPNIDGKTCTVISTVYETKYADKNIFGKCPSLDIYYYSDKNTKPCSRIIQKISTSIINRTYIPATYITENFNKTIAYEKSTTSNNCVRPSISSEIPWWAIDNFLKLPQTEDYVITAADGFYLENNTCHQKAKICTDSKALNYDSSFNTNTEVIDNSVCTYTPAGTCPTTCGYLGSNNSIPNGFGGYKICDATAACYVPICGNSIFDSNETCDDGNIINGDGCSSSCTVENNWQCFGTPSSCLNTPTLVFPLNDALVNGNPKQSWTEVNGVDHYIYESYRDSEAKNKIHTENTGKNNYRTVGGNQTISFYWRVKAVDSFGNESGWSELKKLNIDNTVPTISSSVNPVSPDGQNGWYWTQPEITLTSTDANLDKIEYQWDSQIEGSWTTYSVAIKPLTEGNHDLYYRAIDKAGNYSVIDFRNIRWDKTDLEYSPQNLSANPNPTSGSTSKIKWEFAKDNTGIDKYEIQWKLDNSHSYSKTVGAGTTEVEIDQLIEGRWTVKVVAFDQSGRAKDASIDLNVDRTSPISPTLILDNIGSGTATLSWNAIDDAKDYIIWYGSVQGIHPYGARVGNITSYTVKGLGIGNYYFIVKAVDGAQNQSSDSNEVNTGTIIGAAGTTPNQPAEGFSTEVLGANIEEEINPTTTPEVELGDVLGSSTAEKLINWWWLLLLLIPIYVIGKKLSKKKQ